MVTAGIPPEIQAVLDMMNPAYQEHFIRGYEAAKKEMADKLKEMEPFSESTSTATPKEGD